jgi:hypothetical protein
MATLANIPTEIIQGTTAEWTFSHADYSPSLYSLKYYLRSNETPLITLTGVAGASDWTTTLSKTTTAAMKIGCFVWQAFAESSTERFLVDSGILLVKQDFAQSPVEAVDLRSPARQRYEQYTAILSNEAIIKTMTPDQVESMERITRQLQWDVKREDDAEKLKRAGYPTRKIFTRFT